MQSSRTPLLLLNEKLSAHSAHRKYLVCVLDGSGSVSPSDFNLGKTIIGSFLSKQKLEVGQETRNPSAKFQAAVIQFASTIDLGPTFTPSRFALTTRLNDMNQLGSGTATAAALQAASTMLQTVAADAEKYLLLITDGRPDNQQEAVRIATRLKDIDNVQLFAVGVGSGINEAGLREIASPLSWMVIKSFSTLDDIVRAIPSLRSTKTKMKVVERCIDGVWIKVHAVDSKAVTLYHRSPLARDSSIKQQTVAMPTKEELVFLRTPPYPTKTEAKIHVDYLVGPAVDTEFIDCTPWAGTAESRYVIEITENPAKFQAIIAQKDANARAYDPQNEIRIFDSDLEFFDRFGETTKINLLLAGPSGAGKSTATNAINAVTLKGKFQQFRTTKQGMDSVSDDVYIRSLKHFNPHINIIDIWGFTDARPYTTELLERLCGGYLKHGHAWNTPPKAKIGLYNENPLLSDMVHAVILFISVHQTTNNEAVAEFKELHAKLNKLGYQCIVLVTKVDELSPKFTTPGHLHEVYLSETVDQYLSEFSKKSNIEREFIIPFVGMRQKTSIEEEPTMYYMVHHALEKVLEQAPIFMAIALKEKGTPIPRQAKATSPSHHNVSPSPVQLKPTVSSPVTSPSLPAQLLPVSSSPVTSPASSPQTSIKSSSTTTTTPVASPQLGTAAAASSPSATPRGISLHLYQDEGNAEAEEMPEGDTMEPLLKLASCTLNSKIAVIRRRTPGTNTISKINRPGLIRDGDVLECLTQEEFDRLRRQA